MNGKIGILIVVSILFFSGCGKHPHKVVKVRQKIDTSPYPIVACKQRVAQHKELRGRQIDRIIVYKKRRKMYLFSKGKQIYTFRVSLGKNADMGNKIKEGDYRTPEGNYQIVRKKCDDRLYRSLMISYPSALDVARAKAMGEHTGGYITIHGQPKWNADGKGDNYTLSHDWTEGCMAVTNRAMRILWSSVKKGTKINIHP